MKDLINSADGLIQESKKIYRKNNPPSQNWKMCLLLEDEGWKIESVDSIENSCDIIVKWKKEEKFHEIRLNSEDQRQWVKEKEIRK